MSWLSTSLTENLSSITGQISTFTKDMLTEGTVEVDDHETELKIAKSRLRELELTLYTQREEYDRVKELNHELQERAEAAELQITSISREYRTLLQEKENEVVQLREQLEGLRGHNTRQDRERLPSFSEDSFVNGSSHDQVQYLKAVISKLQDEKKEWTKNAEKENLHKELDHYQHELATLHTTYSQRIASLNKKHKEELRELEENHEEDTLRMNELEQQLEDLKKRFSDEVDSPGIITYDNSAEIVALREALENSEDKVTHLNQELEMLRNRSEIKEELVAKSSVHTTESQENGGDFELVEKDSAVTNTPVPPLIDQFQTLENISELKQLNDQLQREKQDLVHQRDQAVISEQQTSASLESLKEELSRLGTVTMELMKEVEQSQGVDKEKTIEIESLKKLCMAKKDGSKDEVVKLKDMLAALWKKYAAVVLENEKVRLEVHNVKQRLLFQLQDRHGDTKELIDGLGNVRNKLEGTLEGHREEVHLRKEQLESLLPEVENDVQEQEECVSRLQEQNEQNGKETRDIVSDIGKVWWTDNHVASLQAEKAVLERTIVGLEEKVEELERMLDDTPRSSVSTVISVGSPVRAAADLSEPGERNSPVLDGEESGSLAEEPASSDDEDINRLREKLKEYEDIIQEFELIKEDWEGEKEALENVVVDLRKRLKDASSVEKNVKGNSAGKLEQALARNHFLDEIQELLVKKNYLNEEEILKSTNEKTREDLLLRCTLERLRKGKVEESMLIEKQEIQEYFTAVGASPDELSEDVLEFPKISEKRKEFSENVSEELFTGEDKLDQTRDEMSQTRNDQTRNKLDQTANKLDKTTKEVDQRTNELDQTRNELDQTRNELDQTRNELDQTRNGLDQTRNGLDQTRNELDQTRNELDQTRNELDQTRNELDQTRNELDQTRNELDQIRNELDQTANELGQRRNKLGQTESELNRTREELNRAIDERAELESKLKLLQKELEDNNLNVNSVLSEKDNEVHKLRETVERLQEALSNFENDKNNDLVELQGEIKELRRELREAESSYQTLSAVAEAKNQELTAVIEKKTSLELRTNEINIEKNKLIAMVNERDVKIDELQDACDSVDQRASFLQEEGLEKSRAFSELSEECSLLKQEKSELFGLLEEKDAELNTSLKENDKLSELLHQQEMASEEIKRQNVALAQDLERWRLQMEEISLAKEALNRDLDTKVEEILMLKESNIELSNQSYEYTQQNTEISEKLSMMEDLVSENSSLKSEKVALMEALSQKEISEKELKDSYNLILQEKQQFEVSFSQKANESEKEVRRKVDEIEVLRLEVARLTREAQEKDEIIRAQVSSSMVSGGDVGDDAAAKQQHVRRILEEKDVEITALRTKNESLLTLFADNEQNNAKVSEEHERQIRAMLQQQERMLAEINEKSDQMVALEDRLEMMKIKSASKDQASALIHAEHQKLLHLNESQAEEIGKLREKVSTLGILVAEKDHGMESEAQRLRQRNADLQLQVDALQGEQERLLTLVHEKDKQLSGIVHEVPLKRTEDVFSNAALPPTYHTSDNQGEYREYGEENRKLTEEVVSLQTRVALLNDSVENERNKITTVKNENDTLTQRLRSLEVDQSNSVDQISRLEHEIQTLKEDLALKAREVSAVKDESAREINRKAYEINTLRHEKDEILTEQNAQVEELQRKLRTLLDVISSDGDFTDESFEVLEDRQDFQRLLNKIRTHRARLLSDKENELRSLKEQIETLSSVQNISSPELEKKLELFMREKDEMNQKILEMENEKRELLEEKESELDSLQTQIVDLSGVLKQKEREWVLERQKITQENVLLDKRAKGLLEERDSLSEVKTRMETEATRLREEMSTLSKAVSQKHDITVNEKERRVKELERELEDLKQRYSKSLQDAQNLKSGLDEARELAKQFEMKKEKELERLRTHLLQVEDSYTQEALAGEEREKELRTQLDRIQEQLLSSSHSLQDSNRTATLKMENLQEQLMSMTAHRDEVLAQLEQSQEQSLQYMRSVENLQMVLEQFQREKESELRTLREKNNEQLSEAQREVNKLRDREAELKQLLQNASDALNKADKLGEDLKSKEDEIETLKTAVSTLEADLQSSQEKLRKLTSNNDGKIEKSLMKNMLMAYFNTAEQKRSEVVAVLGHILNFTNEEIEKVGSGSYPPQSSGWFSGLLSYGGGSPSHQHDKTFSELFVSFLEKESENNVMSPSPAQTRNVTATMAPNRVRAPQLPISPLAASTPYDNTRPVSNPLLINSRMQDGIVKESDTVPVQPPDGNALLGSTLRPSLDLPTISNSASSSSALRKILFDN